MKKILSLVSCALAGMSAFAQVPFSQELTPSSDNSTIKLDCRQWRELGGSYFDSKDFVDILAISGDCTVYDPDTQTFAPMKGSISSVYLLQDAAAPNKQGDSLATVYATIDKNTKNPTLGDGGGLITFTIQRTPESKGQWQVVSTDIANERFIYFKNVSFKKVGGTVSNQDFSFTSRVANKTQRFVITENVENIRSNKDLVGFSDTTNFVYPNEYTKATRSRSVIPAGTSVKKYLEQGWPVEVDGITGEVIGKVHRLGRGVTAIATDATSLYFTYGGNPSVLMQYTTSAPMSDTERLDFPKGDGDVVNEGDGNIYLYAYKQNADGTGSFSIPICSRVDSVPDPENPAVKKGKYFQIFDSLQVAKDVALRAGATMFANIGDIVYSRDEEGFITLLISEKGIDNSGDAYSNTAKKYKGELAKHLKALDASDKTVDDQFADPFGRVLAIRVEGGLVSTFIEGGQTKTGGYFFSNPDKLELLQPDGGLADLLLLVKENIPATTLGRNAAGTAFDKRVNEAYALEIPGAPLGGLPLDYAADPYTILAYPFDTYKLYESGSNGSMLSSSSTGGSTFTTNRSMPNGKDFDTYLTVVNGYNGTDKSMIVAVRNIYPQGACLEPIVLGLFGEEKDETTFKAWPNPTNGVLHVSDVANYTVSDVTGSLVKSFSNTSVLDLSHLNKGIYFVKKSDGAVKKIILD